MAPKQAGHLDGLMQSSGGSPAVQPRFQDLEPVGRASQLLDYFQGRSEVQRIGQINSSLLTRGAKVHAEACIEDGVK